MGRGCLGRWRLTLSELVNERMVKLVNRRLVRTRGEGGGTGGIIDDVSIPVVHFFDSQSFNNMSTIGFLCKTRIRAVFRASLNSALARNQSRVINTCILYASGSNVGVVGVHTNSN